VAALKYGARTRRKAQDTPIRRQWEALRAEHPGCILLFQLGDFYESFEEDAAAVAQVCGVTLTSKEFGKGDRVALAGVPLTRLDHYLARLVEAGLHVAIAEQVGGVGGGLVERVVTRVVTPGTVAEPGLLRERENNYLAAVHRGRGGIGLAYVDVTTGEFRCTQLDGDDADARLRAELERVGPAELLATEAGADGLPPIGHLTLCQAWRFDEAGARDRLCARLGVLSLEGFGCAGMPLAVGAAGAIVSYLEENNSRLLPTLTGLRTYSTAGGMALDGHTRRNLELLRNARTGKIEGSLLHVLDRTRTPMGGRLLRRWIASPLLDLDEINRRLDSIERYVAADARRAQVRAVLGRVGDLERQVARAVQGVATPRELLDLAESLRACAKLPIEQTLDCCPDLVDLIVRAIAPPHSGRRIKPGYDPELDALIQSIARARRSVAELEAVERRRTGIKSLKVGYNKVFGYYIEVTRPNLSHVPADFQRKQTLVSAERFVTPELKEFEAEINRGEERVAALEADAYAGVLRRIAEAAPRLRRLARAVGHLDVVAALADVARQRGYCRPTLDRGDGLCIRGARHPVVEASLEPGQFIPNDCQLGADGCQVMVLTGPNMAGKSTYLREVALVVLMAQMGSFVPASAARIGLVDRIFTRVGAQDDIAAGASTFMVEMMEAAAILRHATPRSLVVLDEIGRGTSTFDGLAIARAVVEDIHDRVGARTLFATHFHELARLAGELERVAVFNVAVAEEGDGVVFLRKVVPGAADRSYGIHVARLAGLPTNVTRRAEQILRELEDDGAAKRAPLDADLLGLDVRTLSPLDALNAIWRLHKRAGLVE
jgi:DNA mismatch repair protein MutS